MVSAQIPPSQKEGQRIGSKGLLVDDSSAARSLRSQSDEQVFTHSQAKKLQNSLVKKMSLAGQHQHNGSRRYSILPPSES